MHCIHCGQELDSRAFFCPNCGKAVSSFTGRDTEPTPPPQPEPTPAPAPAPAPKRNLPLIVGVIAVAVIAIAAVALWLITAPSRPISDEKASAYMAEAVSAIQSHNYDSAEEILSGFILREDSEYLDEYAELSEIALAKPQITNTDLTEYPDITVEFTTEGGIEYTEAELDLLCEGYPDAVLSEFSKNGNTYRLTYTFPEKQGGLNIYGRVEFRKYTTLEFFIPFEFVSETINDAYISFVTSNVEKYPEVSLYFKVVDQYGETIENLDNDNFGIREYLNIDDYLERDIIYAGKVDGKDALNVSLAIDRSGSIDSLDMTKIKNATNTFLSKLQFSSGDKAEIIAFEESVMQMCLFTNRKDFLLNGVNSMFPYGTTACYDAIAKSVMNASSQSGSRCVVVFTDGKDNESSYTASDVINLAISKSVPVYTIGVGRDLNENDLRRIASSTGGTYHHIDDYSAMTRVYEEIYREQKNLYHIKYISDTSIPVNTQRRIITKIKGDGYLGECDKQYTPITPIIRGNHSSRYEVVLSDITWEEANRAAINKGGHLVTITSRSEEQEIVKLIEGKSKNVKGVWIGGYTTNDRSNKAAGHWVTGEPFTYSNWYKGEPSRFDNDSTAEFYMMLWNVDGWTWNDQRNDLISEFATTYKGKMGYVIEYEN